FQAEDGIRDGNRTPYRAFGDAHPPESDYLFEALFDYGEYDVDTPHDAVADWGYRPDAFSNYRAGFEIRTTRLCRRVLFFHHFKGQGEYDGLVKSLDFDYDIDLEGGFTQLKAVTSIGYIVQADGSYTHKRLPPTIFRYQQHAWNGEIRTMGFEDGAYAA